MGTTRSIEQYARNTGADYLLNKPLGSFYVNSSHNSFLATRQVFVNPTVENVERCLAAGARCLELDIHARGDEPVITHSSEINTVDIPSVFSSIARNAFASTSDPLVIFLEIFDSDKKPMMQRLHDYIQQYWGPALYAYKCIDDMTSPQFFMNVPVGQLLRKICVVVNRYNRNDANFKTYLQDVVHGQTDPSNGFYAQSPANTPYYIMRGRSSKDAMMQTTVRVNASFTEEWAVRVYPANTLTSENYPPTKYWNSDYTFVSLNCISDDQAPLQTNNIMFRYTNLVPKDHVITTTGALVKPTMAGENRLYSQANVIPSTTAPVATNQFLHTGTAYVGNFSWVSGEFTLTMQTDGNLVIYKGGTATWSSKTFMFPNATLVMQRDGNLVIYNTKREPVWSSKTFGNQDGYAMLDNKGQLVVYNKDGAALTTFK